MTGFAEDVAHELGLIFKSAPRKLPVTNKAFPGEVWLVGNFIIEHIKGSGVPRVNICFSQDGKDIMQPVKFESLAAVIGNLRPNGKCVSIDVDMFLAAIATYESKKRMEAVDLEVIA